MDVCVTDLIVHTNSISSNIKASVFFSLWSFELECRAERNGKTHQNAQPRQTPMLNILNSVYILKVFDSRFDAMQMPGLFVFVKCCG